MKIKELFGTTVFLQPQHLDNTDKFKLHSYFVGNSEVSYAPDVYSFQPTWQGFDYDETLTKAKERGIDVMWTMQGGFNFMNTNGSVWKRMPINESDDPLNPINYRYVKELGFHVAARYGSNLNPDSQRIMRTLMNVNTVPKDSNGKPMTYRANEVKMGMGLVNKIRVQNEYNFHVGWSGLTRAFTNQSYAVCLCEVIDGILQGDPNMEIVLGGQLGPDISYTEELLLEIIRIRGSLPTNLSLDFHFYMRAGSTDQSGGTLALTPEEANLYQYGVAYNNLCKKYNLKKFYMTESGWNSSTSTGPNTLKQKAPILEGFSLDKSAGILMIRGVLNLASLDRFGGVTYYHSREDYDSPPYDKMALNTKTWQPKERRFLCEDFLAKYGEYEVSHFTASDAKDSYAVILTKPEDIIFMSWSNTSNIGSLTPMPTAYSGPIIEKPLVEVNIIGDTSKVDIKVR